jgi:hypothetical protein
MTRTVVILSAMDGLIDINGETLGVDEYGAYGTLVQPESDFEVPEPDNLEPPAPPWAAEEADDDKTQTP